MQNLNNCPAYRIPAQYLEGTKKEKDTGPAHPNQPEHATQDGMFKFPFIMFINCKSGGRIGDRLAKMFSEVVGGDQVQSLHSLHGLLAHHSATPGD